MGSEVGCSLWRRRGLFRSADERRTRVRYSLPSMFFCNIMRRYCGIGGMHTLPRSILRACDEKTVSVQVGARVASIEDAACAGGANARWALFGVSGEAAYHDSPEAQARAAENTLLGYFDFVSTTLSCAPFKINSVARRSFQTVTPCTCAAH